ncbi:Membrane transporter [Pseudozyma hubeiensis]|nr:Membrane transporter [Pseudozyma hubeiensis]
MTALPSPGVLDVHASDAITAATPRPSPLIDTKASNVPSGIADIDNVESAVSPADDAATPDALLFPTVAPDHIPPFSQSSIVLTLNFLLNMTFFIIVPSSANYANELGASTWFSGLTVGISVVVSGLLLVPFSMRYDRVYRFPILFGAVCIMVGEVVYALAGVAKTAWLMLAGRAIIGAGFVVWRFVKSYFTDAAVVGTEKRTMMAACLVTSQVAGMAVGPYVGGLLTKRLRPMTDEHRLWNGYTASGWVMVGVFAVFFAVTWIVFRDPVRAPTQTEREIELSTLSPAERTRSKESLSSQEPTLRGMFRELNSTQKFSVMTMCWFSMVNFLVLGAWEVNIPIFGHLRFGWSEYNAGNVIALGGLATMPILFALVFAAKYIQDRLILAGGTLFGLLGLSLHLGALESPAHSAVSRLGGLQELSFGSFFTSWFFVSLGFNALTTITLALLSKQIPAKYNGLTSTVIQLSNNVGRIWGALWGATVFQVGQFGIVSLELTVTLIGTCLIGFMWRKMNVASG